MKVNQLKAGVILSYISEFLAVVIGLVYTPIMLRILGQSEYGLYQLSASVISYLSLISLGLGASYIRYYAKYKVNDNVEGIAKLNGMFLIIFLSIGLIAVLAGSILVLNAENIFRSSLTSEEITKSRILMSLMIFNLSVSLSITPFNGYIMANERYIFQRIIAILKQLFNPLLTMPLLLLGYKSVGIVIVQTALTLFVTITTIIYAKKNLRMSFDFKKFEFPMFKEMFAFSFWIFLNQIIDQVNWQVDKFVLGMVSGTIAVAIYGVAAHVNTLYITFSSSISYVFVPKINHIVAETNDNKILTDLFTRVGRIQFIILMLVLSGFIVFGQYFITLWAGDGYEEAYQIILLLIIPVTVPLFQNLGITIQQAKNKHQFRSIVYTIIAILNVALSIPLAMLYGGIGAAIGTAVSLTIGNIIIMNIYYHKKLELNIICFWKQIFKFVPALLIPCVFGMIIMIFITFSSIWLYVGLIVAYAIIYCLSMWFFGMNNYEKNLISAPIKKLLGKKRK